MQLDDLALILERECGLDPRRKVVVGVSGGADSLCLLDVLRRLGYPMLVAHLDHRLRAESGSDADRVERLVRELGVAFVRGEADVNDLAIRRRLSIEEAARMARYEFLFKQARACDALAVVVGHTADDQVETVLMHLLRGAGLSGLKGMRYSSILPGWDASIPLVRPLLGVWREETAAYCVEHGLQVLEDATNRDTTLFRNRLRHALIPYLKQYNPKIKQAVWRSANTLAFDHEVLEALTDSAWETCVLDEERTYVILSRPQFLGCRAGLRRRLVRRALARLRPGLRDIDYQAVERAIQFAGQPSRSLTCDLIGSVSLALDQDRLIFSTEGAKIEVTEFPQMPLSEAWVLPVPGSLPLQSSWMLVSRLYEIGAVAMTYDQQPDRNSAWLDADKIDSPLIVRPRRDGDRFEPLGMDGHSLKLSDFFVNERVPRLARPGYPLVCLGDKILWIPGYRQAHAARITSESRRGMQIKLFRE